MKRLLKDVVVQQRSSLKLSDVTESGKYPVFGASGLVGYRNTYQTDLPSVAIIKDGAGIGRVSLLPKNSSVLGTMQMLTPNVDVDNVFLYYYLTHLHLGKSFTGSTIPHIYFKNYGASSFPNFKHDEQVRIAIDLTNISNAIENKHVQLNMLDGLVKSRFVEMFGDPMDEKKWNSKFTEVVIFNPKKSEVKKDMEIEASFVPMEAIGTDGSFSIKKSGKIKDFYKGYTYFKDGDVIFAKITPCFENGKIAIANHCTNKIGFGTTEFHVARPISGKTNAEWVMNLLRNDSLHTYASSKMTGSAGQKRIQTPFFEKLGVYLPPLELQNRFADFVHLVDKSRFVCHSRNFL